VRSTAVHTTETEQLIYALVLLTRAGRGRTLRGRSSRDNAPRLAGLRAMRSYLTPCDNNG
jgi:hypothetical protein